MADSCASLFEMENGIDACLIGNDIDIGTLLHGLYLYICIYINSNCNAFIKKNNLSEINFGCRKIMSFKLNKFCCGSIATQGHY